MDDLVIWDKATEAKIKNLGYTFSDLISLAKICKNSCIKKRSYPLFNGNILDYYDFTMNGLNLSLIYKMIVLR